MWLDCLFDNYPKNWNEVNVGNHVQTFGLKKEKKHYHMPSYEIPWHEEMKQFNQDKNCQIYNKKVYLKQIQVG